MLISDSAKIGAKLLSLRKERRLTQAQAAELAGIADRTYANIERGTVDMRISTLIALCMALDATPDDILVKKEKDSINSDLCEKLAKCSEKHQNGAEKILSAYLEAIE